MKAAKKIFTRNEAVSMMHRHRAISLREIATHILNHEKSIEQICLFLNEIADQADAQAMVVDLRDTL